MKARRMARVRSGLDLLHDALGRGGWWRASNRPKINPVAASTLLLNLLIHFLFSGVVPFLLCSLRLNSLLSFHAF